MAEGQDERRIVTALFADVAGSTALSERLDPEEAKLIIGEAISRAIRAVEAYGGTINNLMGDGLLALFGAPLAHEDDPERAVRAGLDILATARTYADEVRLGWGVEGFSMRLGIHTGEVVVGPTGGGGRIEYGVMGDTINTAARLEAAAGAEGILVSETTQRQVANRFEWGDARALTLKGKAEPVRAYSVIGVRETGEHEQPAAPMVGRNAELRTALELLERLGSGRGAVLFIVGEPGIGKTRLAAELRQHATNERGYTWMEGRCVSYGESLPYWPYRDLLRNWLEATPTEPELRLRVKLRRKTEDAFPGRGAETYPYLATVLGVNLEPEAAAQVKPLSPESLQFRTFEVLTELIGKLASDRPVIVSLDDLHWADSTSLALTERLLRLAEAAPVMLAISQRPETAHPSWLLKEKAARDYRHLYRELSLEPLARDSETELLSSLAGARTLPPSVRERLLTYAEGNPFYLEQMLRSLVDAGSLVPENGHWTLKAGERLEIPQTLEGVIIARIDRLEPQWRETLTCSSVLGRTFGLELIEAVTGFGSPVVREAVHHLLRLDLLSEEGGGSKPVYRFKHALIQETAYNTLVASKRGTLHRRAAEWYERYYADRLERVYGLIAHHWLQTKDQQKAASYLRLAGNRALAEWALDEAVAHYGALAPLLTQAGRREEAIETLFQLGAALHLAMRYREANEVWQRAFSESTLPPAAEADEPPTAGLRFAAPLPWDINPKHAFFTANVRLHTQLFDSLLQWRPGPYVVPSLADRWEVSDDGRVYRLGLPSNLTCNDGTAFTAHDVVASIRENLEPSTESTETLHFFVLKNAAAYASGTLDDFGQVGVHARGDHMLEFELEGPAPYFIFLLGIYIYSGVARGRETGPFQLTYMGSDRVVIERDRRYRRPRAGNVATVEWIPLVNADGSNNATRGAADVDVALAAFSAQHQLPTGESRVIVSGPPAATLYIGFSGEQSLALDQEMRKALAHATDRTLIEPLIAGQIAARGGLVPPGLPGHTPDIVPKFDPFLAREHLKQSHHRGPVRVAATAAIRPPYLERLLDGWRAVLGIAVELVDISFEDQYRSGEFGHAGFQGWGAAYPDPEYFLMALLYSRSNRNASRWSSPGLDALLEQARTEDSGIARMALFHQADRLAVHDECALIPVVYARTTAVTQPWIHGWWEWGGASQSYAEVTVDSSSPRASGLD